MPTATRSVPATQAKAPPTLARTRVLDAGQGRPQAPRAPGSAAAAAAMKSRPTTGPRAQGTPAVKADGLPGWAKTVVASGLLLAVAMPATVLMSRSMLVQEALAEHSSSKAAMICTSGDARAVDGSSIWGWLFGGSFFSCGDWETRDARLQRERDQAHNNYMARERARQGLPQN
jgi:hypothetical protein